MTTTLKYFFLICFLAFYLESQGKQNQGATFTLTPAETDELPDSIMIQIYYGSLQETGDTKFTKVQKDVAGDFHFSIPNNHPITAFRLYFEYKHPLVSDFYYAEPTDSVNIIFRPQITRISGFEKLRLNFAFSGKGAEKYKVCDILTNNKFRILIEGNSYIKRHFGLEETQSKFDFNTYSNFSELKVNLDSLYIFALANVEGNKDTISKYRNIIGVKIADFYAYEITSYTYFVFFINQLFRKTEDEATKRLLADFYLSKIDRLTPKDPGNLLYQFGVNYLHDKLNTMMEELKFKSNKFTYSFKTQYDYIKNFDGGELGENLITTFIRSEQLQIYISNFESKDSCLNDALNFVKSTPHKTFINDQFRYIEGSEVFDFSFPDIEGRFVGLNDLKGKVFMIDFYGSGCIGCVTFARKFANDIYPMFANNPAFVSVSVSVDPSRERWISEMKKGIYNQKGGIDLYTNGAGFNIPMMQYYKNNALPFILLVDKDGRLISKLNSAQPSEFIAEMIKKNLEEIKESDLKRNNDKIF